MDDSQVQQLIGPGAADQFEPWFYDPFAGVTLQDLRISNQTGAIVELDGGIVFRWPDGTRQSETRRFRVDSSNDPARTLTRDFGRMLQPR